MWFLARSMVWLTSPGAMACSRCVSRHLDAPAAQKPYRASAVARILELPATGQSVGYPTAVTGPDDAYLPREAQARIKIDRQLVDAGWIVQHVNRANLSAGPGVAVREFILEQGHGWVDYLLFVDGQPAGVIEAKPEGTTLVEVEHQSGKYVSLDHPEAGDHTDPQTAPERG